MDTDPGGLLFDETATGTMTTDWFVGGGGGDEVEEEEGGGLRGKGGEVLELPPPFREDSEGGFGGGEDFELPPLQEDGEGGGLGDGSDDGGDDESEGGVLPEGEGGLEDESSESGGGFDFELSELGDGGGLDQPFELGGDLEPESELELLGGGALESLFLLLFSSLDDEELGDGAISDMLSFSDDSSYYVPQLRETSSSSS
nr:unnamed protein product [Digitaria exilis]